jgi:hypothetical protein
VQYVHAFEEGLTCIRAPVRKFLVQLSLLSLIGTYPNPTWAGSFDLGFGIGLADSVQTEGLDLGWDFIFGYEFKQTTNWNLGVQLHLLRGLTSKSDVNSDTDMAFDSTAVTFTARPDKRGLNWIQLKVGTAQANYKTQELDNKGIGLAYGVGAVIGEEKVRVHLLDIERYEIEGDSFNIYSINVAILFGGK